jgi:hypothetical protein
MSARDCINRIQQAAGRTLTDDEVEAVFTRIHKAALDIKAGRKEPGDIKLGRALETELKGKSGTDEARTIMQLVAEKAAADLEREAATAEFQAHLQLVRMGARMKDVADMQAVGIPFLEAVRGTLARDYSGKIKVESLEQKATGYKDYFLSKLLPAWDALGDDFMGFLQDRAKLVNLLREMRGENTGDAMAKKGAEVWLKTAEEARQVFNQNGGSIGKLVDWAMPQHHSQAKVAVAGVDAWINDVMPRLDRTRYADDLGTPRDDAWMKEFLTHAWTTIATNGHSKDTPGEFKGSGKRINRHAEERQIHFKSADDMIEYWETFGKRTAVEIMQSHIETMARDIAFVEHYGPNPNTTFRTLREQALKDATVADPVATPKFEGQAAKLDQLWMYASGASKPSYNPTMSAIADGLANLNVAGKLGGAVWASVFGDKPLMEAVSHMNDLPMIQRWRYELGLLNPMNRQERRLLQEQGLMLDSVRSGLQRFYEGLGKSSTTGRIANAIMRISGMQAINDIRKGAFGGMLMGQIGAQLEAGRTFADLATGDVRALKQYGITAADWNVWKQASLQDVGFGTRALTPEAISNITDAQLKASNAIGQADGPEVAANVRRDAIVKLLGIVNTETEFAVITPGWRERSTFYGDLQRGTAKGEIVRSMLQFKAFPWAQFQRAMDAVANQNGPASKAVMTAFLIASTTLAGAMIMQVREMLAGKDPRPMNPEKGYDKFKFWGAAFLQGGALGIYGDFLSSVNQSRYGTGPLEVMAGPTIGPLLSLGLVQPMNAAAKTLDGKDTHLAAQTIAQLKGFVPGNNFWVTKGATEHLVWQRVMEMMSPGYLSKIRERTLKDYGQRWWWEPGEAMPDRWPDLQKAYSR